jgi:hypothetical protein
MRKPSAVLTVSALMFLSLGAGFLLSPGAASGEGGIAAEPACTRWQVSIWNTADTCDYRGGQPYINRNDWCTVPQGAEPMGLVPISGYGGVLWGVRRCVAWGSATGAAEPVRAPARPPIRVESVPLEVASYAGVDADTEATCRATIGALTEQAAGLSAGTSIAALQAIEDVGPCTGSIQLEALGKIARTYGLTVPGD